MIAMSARVMVTDSATLEIGYGCHVSPRAMIRVNGGELRIGSNVFIGQGTVIAAATQLLIGDDALIAENVTIRDQDHGTEPGQPYRIQTPKCAPVRLGNNVWLGAGVVVVKALPLATTSSSVPVASSLAMSRQARLWPDRRQNSSNPLPRVRPVQAPDL